jgi:cytochrome bd-type quinol oxidase subunit 2
MNCPECGSAIAEGENFCARCGHRVGTSPEEPEEAAVRAQALREGGRQLEAARKGRRYILAVAILTLVSGVVIYMVQKSQVEAQIRNAEAAMAGIDPEERDRVMKERIGMTWAEAVEYDRRMVVANLVVNLVLTAVYFGLWIWARRNAFAAALSALLIFLTVVVVSAIVEPKTLYQGILIKIIVVGGLLTAVSAGYRARRISGELA